MTLWAHLAPEASPRAAWRSGVVASAWAFLRLQSGAWGLQGLSSEGRKVAPHVSAWSPNATPGAGAHRAILHSVSLIEGQPTSEAALLELGVTDTPATAGTRRRGGGLAIKGGLWWLSLIHI